MIMFLDACYSVSILYLTNMAQINITCLMGKHDGFNETTRKQTFAMIKNIENKTPRMVNANKDKKHSFSLYYIMTSQYLHSDTLG